MIPNLHRYIFPWSALSILLVKNKISFPIYYNIQIRTLKFQCLFGEKVQSEIQRDMAIADKLLFIPNEATQITPSVDYNQWLKREDTQLNEPISQIQKKSLKLSSQLIRKLWGLVQKKPIVPSLPIFLQLFSVLLKLQEKIGRHITLFPRNTIYGKLKFVLISK